jgi:hypothetical protein
MLFEHSVDFPTEIQGAKGGKNIFEMRIENEKSLF